MESSYWLSKRAKKSNNMKRIIKKKVNENRSVINSIDGSLNIQSTNSISTASTFFILERYSLTWGWLLKTTCQLLCLFFVNFFLFNKQNKNLESKVLLFVKIKIISAEETDPDYILWFVCIVLGYNSSFLPFKIGKARKHIRKGSHHLEHIWLYFVLL